MARFAFVLLVSALAFGALAGTVFVQVVQDTMRTVGL